MNIKQSFVLALKSLMSSKMRSFLTMLGIIIGVGAVIIIVSLIEGMTQDMLNTFESMGATNIQVMVRGRGGNRSVNLDDMYELCEENPKYIKSVTPTVTVSGASIKSESETLDTTTVTGGNEFYAEISDKKAEYGRDISYVDCEARLLNCVVGTYVASEFYGGAEKALGQTIKINGRNFTIVGVMEEKNDSKESTGDDAIIVPYTVAQKISGQGRLSTFIFCAENKDVAEAAQVLIENYLFKTFSNSNAYTVINMASLIDTVSTMTDTMSLLGACVAGVSLLVGGIGIMNIMLVSVTERTREIGVRKSLGAAPWDILSQFVVEAMTTSCIGGVIGILFGIAGSIAGSKFLGIPSAVSLTAILISFTISAFIGIAFGYFPAKKAASLNPIDALRYD